MRFEFNISEFLNRQLPHHKLQNSRLALFYWPLSELNYLWSQFTQWRQNMIYEANITGQTLALIDILNNKVQNSNNQINIREGVDGGYYFSTLSENTDGQDLSTIIENTDFLEIPINGEDETALSVNFQVVVPSAVNIDEVDEILKRYVLMGISYEIINI